MAKTPNSNHDCLKGLMFVVCASAAVSALALSAYLFSEVESIARRLDEQAKTLSRLDTSTSTQAKAETPTAAAAPDGGCHCTKEDEQNGSCRLGYGCTETDGTKTPIPAAHLKARVSMGNDKDDGTSAG